jgi:hypothetical protein
MLGALTGNRNVERVLLFLFVNERGYGTQIQSLLQVPLTPVQKALIRLEKEGVLNSYPEGKTRLYQFNPFYPLRLELEALLKKAYTLLSPQEKKRFCFIHKPRLRLKEEGEREKHRRKELDLFWHTLGKTHRLSFSAKSRQNGEDSTKIGEAEVVVTSPTPTTLIFQEKGTWLSEQLPEGAFSNSFRWTLDLKTALITVEHLRYGAAHPVFLFHLTPTESHTLESVDAHLCGEDTYLGNIVWSPTNINFYWRIIGPHKNNRLTYHYFCKK